MCHDESGKVGDIDLTIVIPLRNEEANVVPLYDELSTVMDAGPYSYEVLFIDDGSKDRTLSNLENAIADDPHCTILHLTRSFGQTAAMAAGFEIARGRVIVPMDGDLQNDPRDIAALVAKLDESPGYDVASGWRKNRQDKLFSRRFPSLLANKLIRWMTNTQINDLGCTLKAYRREALEDVKLYGEMHRFLPVITRWRGARIAEVVVNHRARIHGKTKYDLRRTIKVLLDLVTVKFLGDYLTKPIYFFGKLSLITMAVAFFGLTLAVFQKYGYFVSEPLNLNRNVLLLLAVMLVLMAVMFLVMGVLSELLVRIYHESQGRRIYKVRETIHGGRPKHGGRPEVSRTAAEDPVSSRSG